MQNNSFGDKGVSETSEVEYSLDDILDYQGDELDISEVIPMEITMLGTGHALVTECYNTCFVINDNGKYFMVDGGGGNTILHQIKCAGFDWMDMREIFVTHKHIDHLMGIIWMVRMICQFMNHGEYKGEANIYGHDDVIAILREIAYRLLQPKETRFIDDRLHLITVSDGEERIINGRKFIFFEPQSLFLWDLGFLTTSARLKSKSLRKK